MVVLEINIIAISIQSAPFGLYLLQQSYNYLNDYINYNKQKTT